MKKIKLSILSLIILATACSTKIDSYIKSNPDLKDDKKMLIRQGFLMNTMTPKEVKLILGEPSVVEEKLDSRGNGKWIYKNIKGIKKDSTYKVRSAFSQGIGCVVPFNNYQCDEIQIKFKNNQVFYIERILKI